MSRSELRAMLLAALVLGAVLATLAMSGCGASARTLARPVAAPDTLAARQAQRDGLFMVLGECETWAESVPETIARRVYEDCLATHGI